MLLPLAGTRGHDLGWIGLTVPGESPLPYVGDIRRRVEALAATL